jgi:hypothetical protein
MRDDALMTGGEIAVVVIDPVPSGGDDPRTTAEVAEDRLHGILEGGLLVAVGLSALAVDGIVSAILRAGGIEISVDGAADGQEPAETSATDAPPTDTAAVFVGAALDLAFEASRGLVRIAAGLERAIRPLTLVAMIPPVDRAARRLEEMAIRRNDAWQEARTESSRAAELFADAVVPPLVDAVVDRLDLTDLVLDNVDLERVIAEVDIDSVISRIDIDEIVRGVDVTAIIDEIDIDAVAARVDVQKIVDRLDLVAIAQGVVDELDLPAIIRGSTETMAAETVDGIRVQGMHADRFVARIVDRTLHRRNGAPSGSTDPSDHVEDES